MYEVYEVTECDRCDGDGHRVVKAIPGDIKVVCSKCVGLGSVRNLVNLETALRSLGYDKKPKSIYSKNCLNPACQRVLEIWRQECPWCGTAL